MKLPERGALVDPEGKLVWLWGERVDPDRDFEGLPPILIDESFVTGVVTVRIIGSPEDTVVDLRGLTDLADVAFLVREKNDLRIRIQPDHTFKLTKIIAITDPETHEVIATTEVDHPLQQRKDVRLAYKATLALAEGLAHLGGRGRTGTEGHER
jgi:hypothetical protein